MSAPTPALDPLLGALEIPPGVRSRELPLSFEQPDDQSAACRPNYVIAMTARTGSSALRQHIAASGVLGDPRECFNPRAFLRRHLEWSGAENIAGFLAYARQATATDNGCFGVTTNFWDFYPLIASGLHNALFVEARFVHLSRRDLLAQAVSLHIARSSGVWHRRGDGTVVGRPSAQQPVPLDLDMVARQLRLLAQEDANWRSFFAATGIRPLHLVYEDIAADMTAAVARIGEHVGIAVPPFVSPENGYTWLASSLNRETEQRFRAACQGAGALHADPDGNT